MNEFDASAMDTTPQEAAASAWNSRAYEPQVEEDPVFDPDDLSSYNDPEDKEEQENNE